MPYISRASEKLSSQNNSAIVLSFPIRRTGKVFSVITLERQSSRPFSLEEITTIRLICELISARLYELHQEDRSWFEKSKDGVREFFSNLLEPKQTNIKAIVLGCFLILCFVFFGKGDYKIKTSGLIEASKQQIIPAPFDGYIKDVFVEVNDQVVADKTVLSSLDTAELGLQLAETKAELSGYQTQASAAMRDKETAQVQIANANAAKAKARMDLLNYKIHQAELISPIDGIVVKGDLKQRIGAPVKIGDILFEVSPLKSLRAELMIPEADIYDVKVGQEGFLATASYPDERIAFIVERINPLAEVVNQRNVFKVRVRLKNNFPWMRPGMEGVAKISAGKRSYAWIWTRKLLNWIRMKLWL